MLIRNIDIFLDAMSSSRSDDVTVYVRMFVCMLGFFKLEALEAKFVVLMFLVFHQFLAAMSSLRSDDVTHFVCMYVCHAFLMVIIFELFKACFKHASSTLQARFKHASRTLQEG